MKTERVYKCHFCGTAFDTADEAYACEDRHEETESLVPLYKPELAAPYRLRMTMTNGAIYYFRRENLGG